jgi:putative phosphoesterase
VGVISDTHGFLSLEAANALRETDMIIHAGDIGKPEVLDTLRRIAPVVAVRGNMDSGAWARELPESEIVDMEHVMLYVLHDVHGLDLEPSAAGIGAVISGHTHRPSAVELGDVLFLNPGSATYPRFNRPASIALLHVRKTALTPQFVHLKE